MVLGEVILCQRSCSLLTGAEVTGKLASNVAWKEASKKGIGLFGKKREEETGTVEEVEEEEEEGEEEEEEVLSLHSHITNSIRTPSQPSQP